MCLFMTHTWVILVCADGGELFLWYGPGWNGWLILLLQCPGWGTKAGSSLRGNWPTDGMLGREACEVSGLTLTLCPCHGWPPEVERVCPAWPYLSSWNAFFCPCSYARDYDLSYLRQTKHKNAFNFIQHNNTQHKINPTDITFYWCKSQIFIAALSGTDWHSYRQTKSLSCLLLFVFSFFKL